MNVPIDMEGAQIAAQGLALGPSGGIFWSIGSVPAQFLPSLGLPRCVVGPLCIFSRMYGFVTVLCVCLANNDFGHLHFFCQKHVPAVQNTCGRLSPGLVQASRLRLKKSVHDRKGFRKRQKNTMKMHMIVTVPCECTRGKRKWLWLNPARWS